MADAGGNTVTVRFVGNDASLVRSLRRLQAESLKTEKSTKKMGDDSKGSFDIFSKGANAAQTALSKMGSVGSAAISTITAVLKPLAIGGAALNGVIGVAGAIQQLSGIALLAPAAIGVLGASVATLMIGLHGFGAALGGDKKALADLAPSARDTALAIQGLGKDWKVVQQATQQALFKGFADDVKKLGSEYLPVLHAWLPKIASAFNVMGHEALKALAAPAAKHSIVEILSNTKAMLDKMPHSLSGVITGFLTLAGAGSKYLVPLGGFIDTLSLKFAHWADGLVSSGKFDGFVKIAKQGFDDLWHAAGNLLETILQIGVSLASGAIFSGIEHGGGTGGSPLQFLRDMTQALKDFFAEAKTKDALFALGRMFGDVAGQVQGTFLDLMRQLRPIIIALQPIISTLADAVGTTLRSAFDQLGPPIAKFIDAYGPSIENAIQDIGRWIRDVLIPVIAKIIDYCATHKDELKGFFIVVAAAAAAFGLVLLLLSSPILAVIGGLALLGAAVVWLGGSWKSISQFMEQVFLGMAAAILTGIGMILHGLGMIPGPFQDSFNRAGDSMQGAAQKAVDLSHSIDGVKPKDVQVTQHGAQQATADAKTLKAWLDALPRIKQVEIQVTQTVTQNVIRLFSNPFGARAEGGPVSRGETYLVGEKGPELVTMGANGFVTPNGKLGPLVGGPGGNANAGSGGVAVTFMGNTSDALATVIMQMVRTGQIQLRAS